MMIKGMTLGALWRRGWWVILLIAASELTLGVLYLVLGYVFKPLSAYSFEVAAAIVGFIVQPVVLGLFFEVLASDLPRLGHAARIGGAV